jgi:predicted  nucleic acid-binding Zn-ribbon protein
LQTTQTQSKTALEAATKRAETADKTGQEIQTRLSTALAELEELKKVAQARKTAVDDLTKEKLTLTAAHTEQTQKSVKDHKQQLESASLAATNAQSLLQQKLAQAEEALATANKTVAELSPLKV